jgi:prepilin-type N-terminal cleavage/methylation domain-containing protein
MKLKRAFTLTELLVVIAIIALLLAILMPSLAKARLQAKILVVNAELSDIGLALEAYGMDNGNKFPPTRIDCNPDAREHFWALPQELVESGYMPKGKSGDVTYSKVEDKFNPGLAYKYIAVGPRSYYTSIGTPTKQPLWIADGFPEKENEPYHKYDDPKTSPATWVVFSLGPKFDENNLIKTTEGFPASKQYWYSPKTGSGIITRVRLKDKLQHIGTFQKGN